MFAFKTFLSTPLSLLLISSLGAWHYGFGGPCCVTQHCGPHAVSPSDHPWNISNDVPSQCKTACAPLEASTANITVTNPVCTNAIASQFEACLLCIAPTEGVSKATVQVDVNAFTSACADAGFPINTITVPSGAAA
ncbi:hypothetical protein B0H11DRAFT_2268925 [Mycena galericulata]|nr:hypothetical protein B0H11DRAFT_2268925 [Mycena galericulata]